MALEYTLLFVSYTYLPIDSPAPDSLCVKDRTEGIGNLCVCVCVCGGGGGYEEYARRTTATLRHVI